MALVEPQNRYGPQAFAQLTLRDQADIACMKTHIRRVLVVLAVVAVTVLAGGGSASAADCQRCRGPYGGKTMPCDETGCGPRYWGAYCDEPNCPDPCNCRNEWCGGGFKSPSLDLLAPWQMPPGKGFWSPEQCGYATGECHTCGPGGWMHHLKPAWWRH